MTDTTVASQQRLFRSHYAIEGCTSGALFSPCRTYRYALWRHWDWQGYGNVVGFVGLNPSTADEQVNDPTIRRCIDFAKRWGYGGLVMLNLFAYRATLPQDMKAAVDPIGPDNNEQLSYYQSQCGKLVAAWGKHGSHKGRQAGILDVLRGPLFCLGVNGDGSPKHPLYIRGDTEPIHWPPTVTGVRDTTTG